MTTYRTRSWISRRWRHENTPRADDLLCCAAPSLPAVQVSSCVDIISFCSDLISHCLLMFGWSWQNVCIHNMAFFSSRQPAGEPRRTSCARLGWHQTWSSVFGFSCGCTCAIQERKKNDGARKCFAAKRGRRHHWMCRFLVQAAAKIRREWCVTSAQQREIFCLQPVFQQLVTFGEGFWNIKVRKSLIRSFCKGLLATQLLFSLRAGTCSRFSQVAADMKRITAKILTFSMIISPPQTCFKVQICYDYYKNLVLYLVQQASKEKTPMIGSDSPTLRDFGSINPCVEI